MKHSIVTFHFEKKFIDQDCEDQNALEIDTFLKAVRGFNEYSKEVFHILNQKDSFQQKIQGIQKGSFVVQFLTSSQNDALIGNFDSLNEEIFSSLEKKTEILPSSETSLIKDGYKFRHLMEKLQNCMPEKNDGTNLTIITKNTNHHFDSSHKEYLKKFSQKRHLIPTETSIIGKLVSWKFTDNTLSIVYPPTNKKFSVDLLSLLFSEDDMNALILQCKNELVQFFGTMTFDDQGEFVRIDKLHNIMKVDLSPIQLQEFQINHRVFKFNQPQVFTISLDSSKQIFTIFHEESGIHIHAETRDELKEILKETVDIFWEEYVLFTKEELLPVKVKWIREWFKSNLQVIDV